MTVTNVDRDLDARTLTITAEFDAPLERVWELWADPRKLERWWGPPTVPATFERHELEPGGTVTYFMTSSEGERFYGVWHVVAVDPPRSLHVEDSFADADGNVNPDMPTGQMHMRLTEEDGRTRVGLEHRGMEAYGDRAQEMRDTFGSPEGWAGLLTRFAGAAAER